MSHMSGLQLLVALLAVAAPVAAQETPAPPGPPPAPAELVFDREVFEYPSFQRRNPFRTLVGNVAGGPRFEQIRLRGIIWSADPAREYSE